MVGAKQFAIGHKIVRAKEINPLLKKILLPKFMQNHEAAFKTISGSFLDKLEPQKQNKPANKRDLSLLDRFIPVKTKNAIKDFEDIPEEIVDYLTYRIFKNIKNYLGHEMKEGSFENENNRRIQISIDM